MLTVQLLGVTSFEPGLAFTQNYGWCRKFSLNFGNFSDKNQPVSKYDTG